MESDSKRVSESEFQTQVWIARGVYVIGIALAIQYSTTLDKWIEFIWTKVLYHNSLFKHDTFEPLLSSFWFFVVFMFWYVVDFHVPSLHKYRILPSDSNETWMGRQSVIWNEGAIYLLPWVIIDFFFPRRKLPTEFPTFYGMITEIAISLFYYDLLFFIGHIIMHKSKYLYKHVHACHHMSPVIRATDTIRHTAIDGSWDVACSVMALKLAKAHFLSRSVYNIIAITLITEVHSGMNFPWMIHNVVPFHLLAGSQVHEVHHRIGHVNFQKYLTYLDYFFGTLKLK